MCSAPLTLHTKTAIHVAELMTGVRALVGGTQRGCETIDIAHFGLTLNHSLTHCVL